MPTPTYEDALAAAVQVMQEIARRDQFIADANARLAHRPTLLQHLVNHPILWLALGRDGIDRPGSAWTNLVGQQVVTVTRTSRWMVLLVASLMLFLGLGLGVALATWLPLSRLMHDLISTRS